METTVTRDEALDTLHRLCQEVAIAGTLLEGQDREAERTCLNEAYKQLYLAYESFLKDRR